MRVCYKPERLPTVRLLLLVATAILTAAPLAADPGIEAKGRVLRVTDGDRIRILSEGRIYELRLRYIDAPDIGQAHGAEAKSHLATLIADKTVTATWNSYDRDGRALARVIYREDDINIRMIKDGYAWHAREDADRAQSRHDHFFYGQAEEEARRSKRGLWVEADPVPPWHLKEPQAKAP